VALAWITLAAAQGLEEAQEAQKKLGERELSLAEISEAWNLSEKLCAKIPNCRL
jgi:hypothetical protein